MLVPPLQLAGRHLGVGDGFAVHVIVLGQAADVRAGVVRGRLPVVVVQKVTAFNEVQSQVAALPHAAH
jgi:hypothetical protein